MRAPLGAPYRPLLAFLLIAFTVSTVTVASARQVDIADAVARIFAERDEDTFVAVVLDDSASDRYLAFYVSAYLELRELRAYVIPYASADQTVVQPALEAGDHAAAFTSLLSTMRLSLGSQYVSDVNLDGINEDVVTLGEGTIRDGFHHEIFSTHGEADEAYRSWLARALELQGS